MEKKTKQQIIGIFIIIALIIIILPLLFSKTPHEPQSLSLKSPPLPEDQPVENTQTAEQTEPAIAPVPIPLPSTTAISQTPSSQTSITSTTEELETIESATDIPVDMPAEAATTEAATNQPEAPANKEPFTNKVSPSSIQKQIKPITMTTTPLKAKVWVIQLGSFKNKDNAIKLANKLKSSGYKAFLHSSVKIGQTNVYIGRENNKTTAKILANKIEKQFHMRGIILSSKPLEL